MQANTISPAESRRTFKQAARSVVKSHYLLLVILCLVSVFYGTEFGFIKESATSLYHAITGTFSEIGETTLKLNADSSREKVFNDLLNDNIAAGRDKAAEQMLAYKEAKLTNSVVGRRSRRRAVWDRPSAPRR